MQFIIIILAEWVVLVLCLYLVIIIVYTVMVSPYWPIYPPGILIQSLVPNGIFVCVKLVFHTADILLGSAIELLYLLIILFLWWRSGIRHCRCVLGISNILVYITAA